MRNWKRLGPVGATLLIAGVFWSCGRFGPSRDLRGVSMKEHHKSLLKKLFGTGKSRTPRGGLTPGKRAKQIRIATERKEKEKIRKITRQRRKQSQEHQKLGIARQLVAANFTPRENKRPNLKQRMQNTLKLARRDPLRHLDNFKLTRRLDLKKKDLIPTVGVGKDRIAKLDNAEEMAGSMSLSRLKKLREEKRREDLKKQILAQNGIQSITDPSMHDYDEAKEFDELSSDYFGEDELDTDPIFKKKGKARFGGSVRYSKPRPSLRDFVKKTLNATIREGGLSVEGLSNIVCLGGLPHYFEEKQMEEYFSQFGPIRGVKLARNPATGMTRHYGFIEFHSKELAYSVAQHHSHLPLSKHRTVRARVLPLAELHPNTMVSKPQHAIGYTRRRQVRLVNRHLSQQQARVVARRRIGQHEKRLARLREAGLDYHYEPKGSDTRDTQHNRYMEASREFDLEYRNELDMASLQLQELDKRLPDLALD